MERDSIMRYLGDDGVGAFGVACYYMPFIFMIGNAVAQSAQPIISFNFGRGNGSRVAAAARISLFTAFLFGVCAIVAFVFWPDVLVGFFIDGGSEAAFIAADGFPVIAAGFVFFIVNIAMIGYCQSLEMVVPATIFALLRGVVFFVPAFIFLPLLLGEKGVWLALPVAEMFTTVVILVFCVVRRWRCVIF